MQPGITRQYTASGAIPARSLVKFGASDDVVTIATANSDLIIGVSERIDVADGERVDVVLTGIAEGSAAGVIARGADVTSDGNGKCVACSPGAGTAQRRIGIAQATTANGDQFELLVAPGKVTTN